MWSNWRIWFTWVFAILFGVLSTAGEGLHLLPGQGHGHGACCHDACCHDRDDGCKDDCRSDACCNDDGCDDDACVGDSADHSPAAGDQAIALVARLSAGVEVHGLPSVASRSTFCLCDDNCAICKFFGQAVWHTPAADHSRLAVLAAVPPDDEEGGRRLPLGSSSFSLAGTAGY